MAYCVGFISLGCAKNQVDCEQMMFRLQEAGYTILPGVEGADLVVINTCGFIDSAKSEAIDNIIAMGQLKKAGVIGKILVTGCLAQRYQNEIVEQLPEVDGVLGTGSYYDVVWAANELLQGNGVEKYGDIDAPVSECGRILTTPRHYAYLKIAEGCNNRCAYCVIPQLRGKYRSRQMDDILYEARMMAEDGVKELIVVAQDTTLYGVDLPGHKKRLPELLKKLCQIEKIHWIRVHYMYPEVMTDELIDVIASEPKIVKYVDLPIQHVNDTILKKMNRRGTKQYLSELFTKLRERIDGVVLRTSLIAGLPGEGEAEFEELCNWLKTYKLERVGAFVFSPEEGTPAAGMERPDEETAMHRAAIIEQLQSRIMDEYCAKLLGTDLEVLCEGYDRETDRYFGRSYADSPDIDGRVWFTSEYPIETGSFITVHVDSVSDGDLSGTAKEVVNV